ncbi:MAG: hypothetical protein SGJ00_08055 [bacterium]|nr:hypothetical protein [bacterium]
MKINCLLQKLAIKSRSAFLTQIFFTVSLVLACNIHVFGQSVNIAPLATATALCSPAATAPFGWNTINDQAYGTCGTQTAFVWTATPPDQTEWMEWSWPTPQKFDKITIFHGQQNGRYLSGGTVQIWNGSAFVDYFAFSGLNQGNCDNTLNFPGITTSRMRIAKFSTGPLGQLSNLNFREIEIWSAPSGYNDAGVVSIDSPSVFVAGTRNVRATIKNFGVNIINPVTVNWSVNGALQLPVLYSSPLDTFGGSGTTTAQVVLGSYTFASNILYDIKAWTSDPNNTADTTNLNDSAFKSIRSPLSGNYTIGVTGDFHTITSAANSLSSAGITGPVNFQFIDNAYNRSTGENFPITISSYLGMLANRPVTFRPAVGINPVISDSNSSSIFILDGAKYITISGSNLSSSTNREMLIQNRSINTSSNVIILRNEAIGNSISNINFRSGNNSITGGAAPAMVFIGGTNNILGIGNDSNAIRHNTFSPVYNGTTGFKYGKGIVVSGQSAVIQNDHITIDSNYFYGYTHAAIYVTETNSGNGTNFNISGNSIYDTALATISSNNIYGIWFNPSNVNSVNNNISGNFLGGTSPFNGGTGAGLPKQSITHTGFWYYYGIFSNASVQGLTAISNNTIRNIQFNLGSTGYFQGIYTGSGMVNILNNTIGHPGDTNNILFNGGGSNICTGFSGIYSFSTGISNIKNNIISSLTATEVITNTIFGIYTSGNNSANINIDSNVVSRINTRSTNTNTTTCAAFIGLFSGNASPNVQIRGNIIGGIDAADSISLISPTPSGTRAMGMYITGGINTIINNRVQNMYTNSNAQFGLTQAALGGIYLQSIFNGQIMNNNYIGDFRNYGINTTTNAVFGLASFYGLASVSGAATINNNTIRDFYVTSTNANTLTNANINGIVLSTSNIHTVSNNTIANLINMPTAITVAGTQVNGIFASVNNQATLTNNNISRLIFSGPGAGSVFGINSSSGAANQAIDGNVISRLISSDTSNNGQTLVGINYQASNALVGNNSSVSRNNINSFGMDFPSSFFPTNSVQYGIQIASGTATIANNLIRIGRDTLGNQLAKAGNYKGIYSTNTGGQLRIYHNNILVDCQPSYGAINTGVLEVPFTPTASVFAFTDIRNNIFVNNSNNAGAASGNHYNVMYPATLFQLFNGVSVYTVTSDFNLHSNAIGTNNFVGRFAGLNFVDINSLRRAGPATNLFVQESSSGYANPSFLNATGDAASVNLRIATSNPTESMGDTTIGGFVSNDFDGVTRTGRPDIGATTGTYTLLSDVINPAIYYSNLANAGNTSNRTFQATIYDAGIIGSGLNTPRVYFSKNQGTWSSAAGTFVSGSTSNAVYDFTIDHSVLGGINLGDSVYYYVIAQDVSAGNINSRAPYALATNVNTVSAPPVTAASYMYTDPIANTVYVGTGTGTPSYPSFTGANGLFAAINNSTLTGNTTVLIQNNVTENGTVALNKWLESGTGNYTLTIRPANGAGQVLVSGTSTTTLGMLRLVGADRVNIWGWSPSGTSADTNLLIRCTSTGTPVLSFLNGGSNDTISGVIFASRNNLTAGVNAGTINLSPTTTTRGLSNLTFSNNFIRMDVTGSIYPAVGIYGQGTIPRLNTNIAVTGNHFINFTSNGVQFTTGTGNGMLVMGNHFYFNYVPIFTSTATLIPILINAGTTTDNNVIANNWIGGSGPFAVGNNWTMSGTLSFTGISLITGLTTGTIVNRNVIQKIALTSTTNTAQATGILIQGTGAIYNVTNNRIGSLTQADGMSSLANQRFIGIQSFATGNITVTGDTISNISVTNAGTIAGIFGISVGSGGSNITNISNNIVNRLITTSGNTGTTTTAALVGIVLSSTSLNQTIANNRITTLVNQNTANYSMYGILVSSGSNVINNNFVYGLNSRSTYTGTTTVMALSGIHSFASVTGAQTITNNTVDSVWMWTATPLSTQTSGISVFNTFGALTLTGNTVKNINSNTININTLTTSGLTGILISCPNSVNSLISRNTVSVINHTHTLGSTSVIGMLVSTSASLVGNTTSVTRNFIHSLRSNSTASPILTGLSNANGFATYANNMVRMGIDSNATLFSNANTQRGIWHQHSTQSDYYHNTVLVSGAPAVGALNTSAFETQFQIIAGHTLNLRNNIFANTTSNTGAALGFHFGLRLQDSLRIVSDNNIIHTPGTNGIAAGVIFSNSRYALLGGDSNSWKSRVRLDLTSSSIDPSFDANALAPADLATLALNANNPAEKSGFGGIVNVLDDYYGNIRANNSPSDIGAHAGNFTQTPDAFPPTISFTPFTNAGSVSGTRTLTGVVFTDNNGIVNSGLNRLK